MPEQALHSVRTSAKCMSRIKEKCRCRASPVAWGVRIGRSELELEAVEGGGVGEGSVGGGVVQGGEFETGGGRLVGSADAPRRKSGAHGSGCVGTSEGRRVRGGSVGRRGWYEVEPGTW